MKSFKDFFHDNNDYLLAIVIVIIAAWLIVWRINVILDYPEKVASQQDAQKTEETERVVSTSKVATGSAFENQALKKNVSVKLKSGGSSSDVQDLIDKDFFSSYSQLKKACSHYGVSVRDIHGGEYTFEAGTSVEDVIDTLTAD
jgi:hypothetical protein